jgi:hypothetical protein
VRAAKEVASRLLRSRVECHMACSMDKRTPMNSHACKLLGKYASNFIAVMPKLIHVVHENAYQLLAHWFFIYCTKVNRLYVLSDEYGDGDQMQMATFQSELSCPMIGVTLSEWFKRLSSPRLI